MGLHGTMACLFAGMMVFLAGCVGAPESEAEDLDESAPEVEEAEYNPGIGSTGPVQVGGDLSGGCLGSGNYLSASACAAAAGAQSSNCKAYGCESVGWNCWQIVQVAHHPQYCSDAN